MVQVEEENFPRGGRKSLKSLKRPKPDDNLFSIERPPKANRPKKVKKSHVENNGDATFNSVLNIQGTLSYKKIQEGMVIVGCIRHITNFSLEIELPGLTFGHVKIGNISDSFTKHLNVKLEDNDDDEHDVVLKNIFQIGQFVLVKVVGLKSTEKGIHVNCTLNPRDINCEKSHDSFKKGMLIWAAVQSVLDHGYEMNLGVNNCRVFLPSKNVDNGKKLKIGEPLWCTIHKNESTLGVTTLRVSVKEEHIKASKIEELNSLHDAIPGMQVEIVTEKITKYGIQGKFLNDYFGYIDVSQVRDQLKGLDVFEEGKLLTAYILYTEPATKITHLTLRNFDTVTSSQHIKGDIVLGKVKLKLHNGIYLKLPTNEICFIANKRLINSLPKNENMNITEAIQAKFPIDSKHTCRILDYNHIMRMYICTVEQFLVKEKVFSSKDVKNGQLLTVTVDTIKRDGLVVTSGLIRGFIPNLHISNVEYSDNLKKKFKEGYKANARVLNVQDGNIILTFKSSLLETDHCLSSLEQAKIGDQYPGVVIHTKPTGALVLFYGDVKGWISKQELDGDDSNRKPDPKKYFYRGQVVNPWVLGVRGNIVLLTLKHKPGFEQHVNIKIGQKVSGFIHKINKDGISIKTKRGKVIGTIPVNHLSCHYSLCPTFLKSFKSGEEIKDLLCIDNRNYPVTLSRREALALNRPKNIIKKLEHLKPGNLIRCSYLSDCESGIYVQPLILDYVNDILIKNKDIMDDGEPFPKFFLHQSIIARVVDIDYKTKNIRLSMKYSVVFDKSIETAVSFFSQQLGDIKYLRQFGYENEWELCQYHPGERVTCKIEQLGDEGGCLVTLPNNVRGLVAPHLCPDNIKRGQIMEGVFLSQDFKDNYAEICLKQDISRKINKVQDGLIQSSLLSSCIVENVIVKNDSVLCVLKPCGGNRQMVYIPLYLHENDNKGCRDYYANNKFKICICGKIGNYLIGMSKRLFLSLDKQKINIQELLVLKKAQKNGNLGTNNDSQFEESDGDSVSLENIPVDNIPDVIYSSLEDENIDAEEESNSEIVDDDLEESEILENIPADNLPAVIYPSLEVENMEPEEESNSEIIDDDLEECEVEMEVDDDSNDSNDMINVESTSDTNTSICQSKNIKFGNEVVKSFTTNDSITGPLPVLPGVSSFFTPDAEVQNESSSDEEAESSSVKKKKKLSPAERAEVLRQEEERISKIEKELADSTKTPESAEQFDRLMLANPNSSELWTKYIAFHIAATEFDKARSVAKRALDTINMTLIEDKFNIWVALLNLENMFGSKESFEKVLEEALQYNDSLQIYLRVIEMLAGSDKLNEMEEKIKKVRNKYKQDLSMWLELGKVYYSINKFKEARNIKEAALKSIQDKKIQLNLIIRFAIMEFKYGEEEQAAAIFETVLNSDPRKVNVWTIYVDQLVKKDKIEQARKVLERSICQRLPLKSMKTLFLKFRMFEEQHGTPDSVEAVKEKAKEYVVIVAKK